jgi:hypothetical protein
MRMKKHLFVAAATVLLAVAAATSVSAQMSVNDVDATAVNCGAFQRWGAGGWTVTSPTSMALDNGSAISLAPGMNFAPGSTQGGVAIPVILDRHCGNQ